MKYLLLSLAVVGCTTSAPTGSACPTTDPPTYATFGEAFFTQYCTGCHSSTATNRHGAPGSQNYDTEQDIVRHASAIDEWAAAGPDAINTAMPDMSGPVHIAPSDAEREQLGAYLACLQGN